MIVFVSMFSVFEGELSDAVPVVYASIADCRIVGRLCVGELLNTSSGIYVRIVSRGS